MRTIDKPTEDAGDVLGLCASRIRDLDLRARLIAVRPHVVAAAAAYDLAASSTSLHTLTAAQRGHASVKTGEMTDLYDQRFAKKRGPARALYERLRSSARGDICPLCGERVVATLDHYLPKATFPLLAVAPTNLVPACIDCNWEKLTAAPTCEEDHTLHPYYDRLPPGRWLHAEVLEEDEPAMRFFAAAPNGWPTVLQDRVKHHLNALKLPDLYAAKSAEGLRDLEYQLARLLSTGGAAEVRLYLQAEAATREAVDLNSWKSAMYRALAQSDWYCEGGFRFRASIPSAS